MTGDGDVTGVVMHRGIGYGGGVDDDDGESGDVDGGTDGGGGVDGDVGEGGDVDGGGGVDRGGDKWNEVSARGVVVTERLWSW